MALFGDVGSMGLGAVFGFLTTNALQGVLTVHHGRSGAFRLYFREGRIFLPYSDQEGIQSLGRVLSPDGVIARAWEGVMRELRKRSDRFRRLTAERDESRRRRYAEEIHDLFLWDEAHFEFEPGELPGVVEGELQAGRGLLLEPQAIVMEVARRADERDRVRRIIPTGRLVLVTRPGREEAVAGELRQRGVDVSLAPFEGNLPLDAQLIGWGGSQLELLGCLASLVETRDLVPLGGPETRARIGQLLGAGNLGLAAGLLGHLAEVEGPVAALRCAQDLIASPAFRGAGEVGCAWSMDGPRAFALLRELLEQGGPFTLTLRHAGGERRLALMPGVLSVVSQGRSEAGSLEQYLVQLGHMKAEDLPARSAGRGPESAGEGATRLGERIGRQAVEQALLEQFLDQLAEVGLWRRTELELRNRGAMPREGDAAVPVVSLVPALARRLREGLRAWAAVFSQVPALDAVLVPGRKARAQDPAARFFARFSPARNVDELCRLADASRLQFVRLAAQGVKNGYLRQPEASELREWVEAARAQGNEIVAYRLIRAAMAWGHRDEFGPWLAAYRGRELLPRAEPAFHGDLGGVGLPSVLQTLHEHRRSGTLLVTAEQRNERLYFYEGDAFVIRRAADREGEEFVQYLLGDGQAADELLRAQSVPESQLGQNELREIKDRFLEVMFWDQARFSFSQNDLPEEFFSTPPGVTKIALQTSRFLLETVQTMSRWDQIRQVVGGGRAVLEFAGPEEKLAAVRVGECVGLLTLIDGRLSFDELVRLSGEPRLVAGQVLARLVEEGSLRRLQEAGRA